MAAYTPDFLSTAPVRFRHVLTLVSETGERTLVYFYADDDGIEYDYIDTAMGDPLPDEMLDWFCENVTVSKLGDKVYVNGAEVAR